MVCALFITIAFTACSGDSVRGDFARAFGSDPAVAHLDLSTADNMPFTGGVGGTVTIADGVSDEALHDLATHMSAFAADRPDGEVSIVLDAEGGALEVPIFAVERLTTDALDRALTLLDDPRVEAVSLVAADGETGISSVSMQVATAPDTFALAMAAPDQLRAVTSGTQLFVHVASKQDRSRVKGDAGPWIGEAERLWTTVAASVPITGVQAEPERTTFTLAHEKDLATAEAVLPTSQSAAGTSVAFASQLVSLGSDATGETARAVLADLSPTVSATILQVWTNDHESRWTVATPAHAVALANEIAAQPAAAQFETLTVTSGDPGAPDFSVQASPAQLADQADRAGELAADPRVVSLRSSPRSADLQLIEDVPDADAAKFADAVLQWINEGARVCVARPDADALCRAADETRN